MKYFEVYSPDDLYDTYVFRFLAPNRLLVRERYRDFNCPECGKFDEAEALLSTGIDGDVTMNAKCELRFSSDEWLLIDPKTFDSLGASGILGLRELARNDHVVVVIPELVPVRDTQSFRELDICSVCGRPRERLGVPKLSDVQVPTNERTVFGYEPANEGRLGRMYSFIATEVVAPKLKKIRGARLLPRT